jgi:D-alanyl-D-alanine carboxypeptidase/D-alanyl-D-alanine-endopeptidase (penicillin-binding protein 4)
MNYHFYFISMHYRQYHSLICYVLIFCLLASCGSQKYRQLHKKIDVHLNSDIFKNQFTGLLIMDPISGDTIFKRNSDKYFTPASNTKIFTLYSSLVLLPDSIPAVEYIDFKDTLYLEGTGDPTLLHPFFKNNQLIEFLKPYEHVAVSLSNFHDDKFGPGWAWEDYDQYFSPERSALPIYGNVLQIINSDGLQVVPQLLKDSVHNAEHLRKRLAVNNVFYYDSKLSDTLEIPLFTSDHLTKSLLENALNKKIALVSNLPAKEKSTLYSMPAAPVYSRMMIESDNFLAEQLLILASSIISDSLSTDRVIDHMLSTHLKQLPQKPRWVDGSGLSRYNLFTPESLVFVLNELYDTYPRNELFSYFPNGGVNGTLENWFSGTDGSYIIAKSGSLGNNYNLSGYLLTRSGKTLIFSFMNNHFRQSSSTIKKEMQAIFEHLYENY